MKFIKTCYGEWINPALIKHFEINHKDNFDGKTHSFVVTADGITLAVFVFDIPKGQYEIDWRSTKEEDKQLQEEWKKSLKNISCENRDRTQAWLDKFIAELELKTEK